MNMTGNRIPDIRTLPGFSPAMSLAERDALMQSYDSDAISAEDVALFEKILHMEDEFKISINLRGISTQSEESVRNERARLFAEVASLTPEQGAAFTRYRRA